MTPKQKREHKQKIKETLIAKGWIEDKWKNLKKEKDTKRGKRLYRYKFQANVLRLEVKSTKTWIRLRSYYYKDVELNEIRR